MRHFESAKHALREILRDIQERGVEVHPGRMQDKETKGDTQFLTKELLNYSFAIIDVSDLDKLASDLVCNKTWADSEFDERISDKLINPGEAWKKRSEVWEEFLIKNKGKFTYTYNERIRTQIKNVIRELKLHPNTRQAILSIYNPDIDNNNIGVDRISCSMFYQFIFRDNKLNIIYNMRSSDYHLHFRNDIYLACKMLNYVAKECNMKVGNFFMNISSLHIYKRDWDKTIY